MEESTIKYGIMGGTFDPIHIGHLVLAEEVRNKLNLDKIIFIPSGNPPHKNSKNVTKSIHRYEMTLLATISNPNFEISSVEIDKTGKTYTVDTIKDLRQKCKTNAEFYFITGADSILDLPNWKNVNELLHLCKFVAATRPGFKLKKMEEKIKELEELHNKNIYTIIVTALQISSTDIRNRIREGNSVKYLLPETVEDYIYKNKLYVKKNYKECW